MARKTEAQLASQRRYREKNREAIRAKNCQYAERKRREAGMPALGTPESTENRRNARKATGAEHGNWKGDDVGYFALHAWVDRHKDRNGCLLGLRYDAGFRLDGLGESLGDVPA